MTLYCTSVQGVCVLFGWHRTQQIIHIVEQFSDSQAVMLVVVSGT